MIQWTPRFVFDNGTPHDVTLSLPIGLWRHSVPTVGGEIESDAGFPASFVVRRTYALAIPLRFLEEEWPTIREMIEWGQTGAALTWYPDAGEVETFEVYLRNPALGEAVAPEPDSTYQRVSTLVIVVRRVDGQPFDLAFFPEV